MASETENLVNERRTTHGDWHHQAGCAWRLKRVVDDFDKAGNQRKLNPHEREAVDMILVKISRIVCGAPAEADHWDDIAGYARLGKQGHE